MQDNEIRQDKIIGSRRFSNYFWSFFLFVGGLGFLLAGLSSYFKINLLPFTNTSELVFIPQGLVMMFYGTLSIAISIYISVTLLFDIGSGYNEYNKIENLVKIVRKGFPGKNREILLTYPLSNVKSIGIKITEGLNPTRSIYLCLKDERNIPLTPAQEPIAISNLEEQAADLAKFLDLTLENL
jgi:Ycf4